MEAPEEVISLGAKDQTHQIVKGKRTKRVRPQSPLPLSAAATTTVAKTEELYQFLGEDNNTKCSANTTTTSSAEFEENSNINNYSSSTEEEEDMANCLILLAQGQSRFSPKPAQEEGNMMMTTTKSNNNNNYNHNSNSSRRFMEASTMGANKAGFSVYECKTCNKTFPSFQALGGHRASHKKLKNLPPICAILDREKKKEQDFIIRSPTPLSFQFLNSGSNLNNKNKVHECSICGAEFASGQALGGHMRRHRAPIGTTATTANNATLLALNNNRLGLGLEADQYDNEDHHHHPRKKRNILSLDLDLNLPAPEDDHQSESSPFAFEPKKQQQQQASLVFSSPHALVDCHY